MNTLLKLFLHFNHTSFLEELIRNDAFYILRSTPTISILLLILFRFGGCLFFIIKKLKVKYLLTFDADGEHRVTDLAKLINGIKRQNADMIIGNRNKFNRWSEYILSFFYFIRFGIKDPISGFKIFSIHKLVLLITKQQGKPLEICLKLHLQHVCQLFSVTIFDFNPISFSKLG